MTRYARFAIMVAIVLAFATPVHGFGWRLFGSRTSSYSSYYYYPTYYSGYYTAGYYYPAYSYSYYVPSYSYYIPTYTVETPVACPQSVAFVPTTAVPAVKAPSSIDTYATPTPAPPSQQTQEPPSAAPPNVKEQRSFYSPTGLAQNTTSVNDLKVGFWNVTGESMTLQVNGQSYQLPGNQALTLQLPRRFSWRVGQQSIRIENVPENRESFEIVLR